MAEAKTHEAEAKTQEAEAKTHEAEAKTQEAEAKTHEAEAKTHEVKVEAKFTRLRFVKLKDLKRFISKNEKARLKCFQFSKL